MKTLPFPPTQLGVPTDFPRAPFFGALPGAQAKLLARKIGDRYVVGLTEDELKERYMGCEDLVQQLMPYCQRKRDENPAWSTAEILRKVARAVHSKAWGQSPDEIDWIVEKVASGLGWPSPGAGNSAPS